MGDAWIAGVVLAAGPSRRFGDRPPKQLALVGGEPMVRRVARRACESRLSEVVVVLGFACGEIERSLEGLLVRTVKNPEYRRGQSTSVRVGLAAVAERAEAVVFLPADQPHLTTDVIDAILDRYTATGAAIVVPVHEGSRGAPVLMDRTLFGELEGLEGDSGGRQLFLAHEASIVEVPLESDRPLRDVDTPEDLVELGD